MEVWSKAIPKLQQKCTTRAADNERRALKMQHYVYAVVHRQKSQTTAQNPELSTVSPLFSPPQPSSHSLTRCHCEVSPYPHIRCSTASNEISNVAEIRFFCTFPYPVANKNCSVGNVGYSICESGKYNCILRGVRHERF